jgi:predicted transcriptional regulator
LLEFLVQPCFRMNLVRQLRSHRTTVMTNLEKLWREGKIMRSRKIMSVSYVEKRPGKGKYWRKGSLGHLWLRVDSPLMTASGIVELELPHTERYTLEETKKKVNVTFIPYKEKVAKSSKKWLRQKEVLEFFKSRKVGAVSGEVAEYFEASKTRAANTLNKMRKKGLLERRGFWNPALGRETPFKGQIQGYVYGLPGTDQAKKRIEQGKGLYSPHVNAMLIEIRKDSSLKRFTPYTKFTSEIGQNETVRGIKILTQIYPSLNTVIISGQGFIYDKTQFAPEDIEKQTGYWERKISKQKRISGRIGIFHEAFAQQTTDLALKNMQIKVTFWRRIVGGKEHYDIRLSNAKQIDRVLQVDFYSNGKLLWRHYYPIECKYYRGGATPQHLREFIDKLRFSREFGTQIELREGNQSLQVHVIKQDVHPILISPYFTKETYQLAKQYHIELVPTWLLGKLAGETIGKKLDMKKLFKTYMKEGSGNMQTFLTQTFRKK